MRSSCVKEDVSPMIRRVHLEAARLHIETACQHLAAAAKHNDGEHDEAERHAEEALAASKIANGKSTEAQWLSIIAGQGKLM